MTRFYILYIKILFIAFVLTENIFPAKYTLISGSTSEVLGRRSATRSTSIARANKFVITKVTLSPLSEGRINENRLRAEKQVKDADMDTSSRCLFCYS